MLLGITLVSDGLDGEGVLLLVEDESVPFSSRAADKVGGGGGTGGASH